MSPKKLVIGSKEVSAKHSKLSSENNLAPIQQSYQPSATIPSPGKSLGPIVSQENGSRPGFQQQNQGDENDVSMPESSSEGVEESNS
jgi:hypothetical protein